MNNLFLYFQVFLVVFLFGGIIIIVFFIVRNIFSPKKIITLRNYIKSGNYKAAINVAKDILNKNKNNVEAHYYLGEAYYNLQKYELALIEYKSAEKSGIYANISEKNLREKLAELFIKTQNIDEALKEYILLIKQNPTEYSYYYMAGELFLQKSQSDHALKYFVYTVKLNKNHVPSLINIGMILYENKNFTNAQKYLRHSISVDKSNYKAYFYLGLIDESINNYKEALKNFEASIKDKDLKIRSLMERGKIYMSMGNYDEAIIELERAMKNCEQEDNIKMNIKYVLANCFELTRNVTEAIILWEEIYAVSPGFKDVAEKLTNYQELRMDDRMKDFMTATDTDFIDMSKGIAEHMGLNVLEVDILSKDSIELFCLEQDTKWRNVKKRPKIIHISRKTSPIDEVTIRNLNEKMREKGVIRSVMMTSSSYSKMAVLFAKERPIELIDKNGLQEILKNANI
ncbi:MAG: tetratricopeptide repeat protein [Spirochaetes bacterium]|nr:tetratricopeptide repeat protein [Spirochaetota bacterium]